VSSLLENGFNGLKDVAEYKRRKEENMVKAGRFARG
jgi:hypothetical protein